MATATARKPVVPLEVRIEATAMAIREEVMSYFKGTCVERLTDCNNVRRGSVQPGRMPYQYQRLDHERENPQMIYLDSLPILALYQLPDRLTLYQGFLRASPGLKKLHESLESFLNNYLVAVKVETDKTAVKLRLKPDDEELFTAVPKVREGQRGDIYSFSPGATWTAVDWAIGTPQAYFQTQGQLTDEMPF